MVAAPAKCQSANRLVESHWKTMVHMARVHLTKKQMPCSYWFYGITQAAWLMNTIPGKYKDHLALPFLLFHGVGHGERMWILLFHCATSIMKRTVMRPSPNKWPTLWTALSLGRSPTSNALMVFNLWNGHYYEPDSTSLIHIGFLAWCILP